MHLNRKLAALAIATLGIAGLGAGTALAQSGQSSAPTKATVSSAEAQADGDNVDFTPAGEDPNNEVPDANEAPEADEANEAPEANDGPDTDNVECEDGIDATTGANCDGGPAANTGNDAAEGDTGTE